MDLASIAFLVVAGGGQWSALAMSRFWCGVWRLEADEEDLCHKGWARPVGGGNQT